MPRRAKRFIPKAVKEPGFTLTSRPLGLAAGTIGYFVCAAALHLSFPKRAVAYRQRLCRLRLSQSYFARRQARRYVSALQRDAPKAVYRLAVTGKSQNDLSKIFLEDCSLGWIESDVASRQIAANEHRRQPSKHAVRPA